MTYKEGGGLHRLCPVHISPISNPHKSIFKSTSLSLWEVDLKLTYEDLKLDLYGLELKLHMVHLAVNFSEAQACEAEENLTAKCSAQSAI